MDIAKALIKCVARAFYDTRHILVLDALMIHNTLRDDELARLLGIVTKDVHKLCGKLKEDRMLAVHTRPEQAPTQQRPVNRTYYFIEPRSTIDGIKYRVSQLSALVRRSVHSGQETKGFVCPTCSKRFPVMEALSLEKDDFDLFLCDRCSTPLVDDEESQESKLGHEKIQRMNRQIEKIERFLREVDKVQIPLNDFDTALANSVPVPRDKSALAASNFVPVSKEKKGGSQTQQQTLEISITSEGEKSAEEIRSEQMRRQQMAEKNALPVWHTQSTVQPGAVTNVGLKEKRENELRARDGVVVKEEKTEVKQVDESGGDAIAQYYAALAAEKAREEAEEEEEEEETDEEEEEFEDLDISAPVTTGGTPANGESEEDASPPGKRAKTETPADVDSDEEVDFEDV